MSKNPDPIKQDGGPFRHRFDQLAVFENGRTPILLLEHEYNRARACWNACDGVPIEVLESKFSGGLPWMVGDQIECRVELARAVDQRDELQSQVEQFRLLSKANAESLGAALAQRDELLEVLEWISNNGPDDAWELRERARAVIAKHETGAPS